MIRDFTPTSSMLINYCSLPFCFGKTRRLRRLEILKQKTRHIAGETTLDGTRWTYPDPVSFAYGYQAIIGKRIYKFRSPKKNPTIIDCGANVGIASVYWKKAYPDAQITAIEADPSVYSYLLENLNRSGCKGIHSINKAVWHKDGVARFTPNNADGGGLSDCLASAHQRPATIEVETISLASIINRSPVDLLKIDIEGAEAELLINQAECLQHVQRIFVEYHSFVDKPQQLHRLLSVLAESGFRLHIHSELTSRRPFSTMYRDGDMDNRLNIFAWR
ncbi:FkbM family methyltransferase [Puniceicoccaceae bacterium]|nr:FkbM family methyltransferase [Puniceicoccaceae bacterium]